MAPVMTQTLPKDNRPENYKRVVIRRSRYDRKDRLYFEVWVDFHNDTNLKIAQMLHQGDAFAYGKKVARRAGVELRSYL